MTLRALLLSITLLGLAAQAQPQLIRSHVSDGSAGHTLADMPDLDGDGRRDFIVGANGRGRVLAYSSARSAPLWSVVPGPPSLGWAVSNAGDIDGDGISDVVAGGPNLAGGGAGAARVLSGADGSVLLELPAQSETTHFGYAVSWMDDLNGDGRPELLVGAPLGGSGRVYVMSGADGSVLRSHSGNRNVAFGSGVARLADIDGDGFSDFVIGAPLDGPGRAYVHSGASGARLFVLQAQSSGRFGDFFVADAGDVDADGITDIYVGAYAESGNNGAAYVYSGADGSRLYRLAGGAVEGLGPGRAAGDVDGDGHADLIVGGYTWSGSGVNNGGRITLYSGADGSVMARLNGTRPGGQFGFDTVGLGDVNGDLRRDFIVASAPANIVDLYAGGIDRPLLPSDARANRSGTWWNPAEAGWGFNLLEQGALVYGTWYSYADDGKPMFLTVEALLQESGAFDGPVYRISGTPLQQINGMQAFTGVTEVGQARLQFDGAMLILSYTIDGQMQTRTLQRFDFDAQPPQCYGSTLSRAQLSNASDLWWNPAEAGWGLTLAQQGEVLFALWYTYGEGGRDQWLSASALQRQPDGSWAGALQRPLSGVPLLQIEGPATSFPVPEVGSARLRFSDGEHGVFEYSVDGVTQRKRIQRFEPLGGAVDRPHCIDPLPSTLDLQLQQILDDSVSQNGIIGSQAAVRIPGRASWQGVAGRNGDSDPMLGHYMIGTGSISKMLSVVAALRLVDRGVIALDDRLGQWFPDIANVDPDISIKQAMQQVSGLADYLANPVLNEAVFADLQREWSAPELISHIGTPLFTAGSAWDPSNSNSLLLGRIVEIESGHSLADFMREELFGERSSMWLAGFGQPPAPLATQWARATDGSLINMNQTLFGPSLFTSRREVHASAAALAAFTEDLFLGDVLSAELRQALFEIVPDNGAIPGQTGGGLGIRRYQLIGRTLYGHSGGTPNSSAFLLFDPASGISVAVSVNQGGGLHNQSHFQTAPALLQAAIDGLIEGGS